MNRYPIVILPGWMLGADRFAPLEKLLVKRGFKTHTVDFPGFEQGEKLLRPWDLSDYVSFVEKFLTQHKISKAIFIAHSFGGRVALKLLSQKPQLAVGLIMTGTPGYRAINSTRLFTIALISKLGHAFLTLPPFSLFQDVGRKAFHIIVGARDISQLKGFMKQTFINVVEEDLEPYMEKISTPTLLIWGQDDGLVPVEIAKRMQKTIVGSTLITIPNAKHNVVYKQPDEFITAITDFLNLTAK